MTTPKVFFEDGRGRIKDLLVREPVDTITVIESKKGSVRANHFHRDTVQWIYVHSGTARYLSQFGNECVMAKTICEGDLIKTDTMEKHAIKALDDCVLYVFTRGPRSGENYEDDTFKLTEPLVDPGEA